MAEKDRPEMRRVAESVEQGCQYAVNLIHAGMTFRAEPNSAGPKKDGKPREYLFVITLPDMRGL